MNKIFLSLISYALIASTILFASSFSSISLETFVNTFNYFHLVEDNVATKIYFKFKDSFDINLLSKKSIIYVICIHFLFMLSISVAFNIIKLRWLVLVLVCYPAVNLGTDVILLRRIMFSYIFLPTIPVIYNYGKDFIDEVGFPIELRKILRALGAISIAIFLLPGFYFPPFFDGINGWSYQVDDPKKYKMEIFQIEYQDSSLQFFRPAFFNPLTMKIRPYTLIKRRDLKFYKSVGFGCFLASLYKRALPEIQNGYLPTQRFLGYFSYPPHTLDWPTDGSLYKDLNQIKSFHRVEISTLNGLSERKIIRTWPFDPTNCQDVH